MNDMTCGATLLTCFAVLVATVMIEITFAPQRSGAAVSGRDIVTGQATDSAAKDCSTVALAPAATAR